MLVGRDCQDLEGRLIVVPLNERMLINLKPTPVWYVYTL